MDLTYNEKRLLAALYKERHGEWREPEELAGELGTNGEAVVQYSHLLSGRGLAEVRQETRHAFALTPEGEEYREKGLPERQLLSSFEGSVPMAELNRHPLARIGIGWLRRKGWVTIRDGLVTKTGTSPESPDEAALREIEAGGQGVSDLIKRGLATDTEELGFQVRLTPAGAGECRAGLELRQEVGTLTSEQIASGGWKNLALRRYNVGTLPKVAYPGKIHPYQRLIDEMRQVLIELGFTEMYGGVVQSVFWNFDALFQPQDHPAREMQDTFYLEPRVGLPEGYDRVKTMHETGGDTHSTGWGGTWKEEKAEQCVLRTHTTCLSIQHLARNRQPPVKAFCIGRVYRREAIDPTHLPEFEQLEGIVMDTGVTFRNLLGFLRVFYNKMGFSEVRFRPGYFPYTEPSVEPEVYVDGLGWVELGGAGVFREEVTAPWGITTPVLAWGLGVSRVASLRMGLKDLRMLYESDIDWIRKVPANRAGPSAPGEAR